MPTKKERKVMKKVIKGFKQLNVSSATPWKETRTKEAAWQKGYESGKTAGSLYEQRELAAREKAINSTEQQQKLKVLSNICQAGSNVVEAMSKALLSYMNNL